MYAGEQASILLYHPRARLLADVLLLLAGEGPDATRGQELPQKSQASQVVVGARCVVYYCSHAMLTRNVPIGAFAVHLAFLPFSEQLHRHRRRHPHR